MHKVMTIKATIPLPDDPFDAAAMITAAKPAIEALREALGQVKGAVVSHSFDARRAVKGGAPVPRTRKPRVAVANPGAANGEAERLV